ncbi:Glycerol acyltransferase [Planctomycetales bacterium 10988]|nr:Glycerol acyltransferase [Planctomycetales bacterium 10988]
MTYRRPFLARAWYSIVRSFTRLCGVLLYRFRIHGQEHVPKTGSFLVVCNHQSHFDPIVVGSGSPRQLRFIARKSLSKSIFFRVLTIGFSPIPIRRGSSGLDGLREAQKVLEAGEPVVIFPEGTRTPDGHIHGFKPGFVSLVKRAKVPLVPAAIYGAYRIWPRNQKLFSLRGAMELRFGPGLSAEEVENYDDRELIAEMEKRVKALFDAAHEERKDDKWLPFNHPEDPPADEPMVSESEERKEEKEKA